jgi:hypothetical protein
VRRLIPLALAACAHAPVPGPKGMARSKEQAAEVCLPPGEKIYFEGLHCPGGAPARVKRLGAAGMRNTPVDPNDPRALLQMDPERPLQPGEPDLHIVDAFEADCPGTAYTLFVDMYHCPSPAKGPPPEGFTRE